VEVGLEGLLLGNPASERGVGLRCTSSGHCLELKVGALVLVGPRSLSRRIVGVGVYVLGRFACLRSTRPCDGRLHRRRVSWAAVEESRLLRDVVPELIFRVHVLGSSLVMSRLLLLGNLRIEWSSSLWVSWHSSITSGVEASPFLRRRGDEGIFSLVHSVRRHLPLLRRLLLLHRSEDLLRDVAVREVSLDILLFSKKSGDTSCAILRNA